MFDYLFAINYLAEVAEFDSEASLARFGLVNPCDQYILSLDVAVESPQLWVVQKMDGISHLETDLNPFLKSQV